MGTFYDMPSLVQRGAQANGKVLFNAWATEINHPRISMWANLFASREANVDSMIMEKGKIRARC